MSDAYVASVFRIRFVLELTVAVLIYSHTLKRRPKFPLRFACGIALMLAAAYVIPYSSYGFWDMSLLYLGISAMEIPFLWLCYREPSANLFFCAIAGLTTQHLANSVHSMLSLLTEGEGTNLYGFVLEWSTLLFYATYLAVYLGAWLAFGRHLERDEDMRLKGWTYVALSGLVIAVDIVINAAATVMNVTSGMDGVLLINDIYGAISCILVLVLLFSLLSGKKLEQENETMRELVATQQRQYTIAKDNIDRINIKCHDLKHQIHEIAGRTTISREEMEEIDQAISIYDATVRTGNEALDTILTEKSLQCGANGIRITCMADGGSLSFMKDADIYTLFGNAVDNAIEAVMRIPDPEQRVIGLKVVRDGNYVCVHIYNYFTGTLKTRDGLPVTSKEDSENHGFGIRSMRQIVTRYGGTLEIEPKEGIFHLNLVFPVRGEVADRGDDS